MLEYRASHIEHIQKALMQMNLQLHHVVSDITGATGMKIIRSIIDGERDPNILVKYRDIRCKESSANIVYIATYESKEFQIINQQLIKDFFHGMEKIEMSEPSHISCDMCYAGGGEWVHHKAFLCTNKNGAHEIPNL